MKIVASLCFISFFCLVFSYNYGEPNKREGPGQCLSV